LFFSDQPRTQVGVYRHLFTRHCVKCKSCGNLSDSFCTFVDNNELNKQNDDKDNETDDRIPLKYEITKRADDISGFSLVRQYISGRRYIDSKSEQCRHQKK